MAVKTKNETAAVIATRRLPARKANTPNSAGVSLTDAGQPDEDALQRPAPCSGAPGQRGSRSATTSAIRNVLTWP